MPYISMSQLKPGMITSTNTYDKWGRLVLKTNTKLNKEIIRRLTKQGFSGLYAQEPLLSDQIEIADFLTHSISSANAITNSFAVKDNKAFMKHLKSLDTIAIKSIKEILNENISIFDVTNLKEHNTYTYTHSVNVATLAVMIGIGHGLPDLYLKELYISGMLHDIGKLFISNDILDKESRLDPHEYDIIKSHSIKGYNLLLTDNKLNESIRRGIRDHHENYDGTGYPCKLWRHEISLYGSIIHVADVFDALTSDRPYHEAYSPSYAYNFIIENSGIKFSPDVVDVFKRRIAPYPTGSPVILSDGRIAIVSSINIVNPWLPVLRVLDTGETIDMSIESSISILTKEA